jgi:peptide/nickel transport system ATP-binding protein
VEASSSSSEPVLRIEHFSVGYKTRRGLLRAVEDFTCSFRKGKIYAIVGESGCGKSTLGLSISRLHPENRVEYSGKMIYKGTDLLEISDKQMQRYRGSEIATIFQEPMTSLDPVYKIGEQIAESLGVREKTKGGKQFDSRRRSDEESKIHKSMYLPNTALLNEPRRLFLRHSDEIISLLEDMRIPNPTKVADMYPHELSGGMRQRVMIAMALAGKPSLLVADEPTTALDVTTQFQILKLIKNVARENNLTILHITHDLGVVAAMADYSIVMYAGMVVERAETKELFENPLHPYTIGLLSSYPKGEKGSFELTTIPGSVPPLGRFPGGCRFHPRCFKSFNQCKSAIPQLVEVSTDHFVSCFLYPGLAVN